MLIQRAGVGTIPPPGFTAPPWALLVRQWNANPAPSSFTVTLGPSTVILGHDDSEAADHLAEVEGDVEGHEFGWDNESPERTVNVGMFRVGWRPVSNGEFEKFWRREGKGVVSMPKSWVVEGEEVKVGFSSEWFYFGFY
jgi:formylglycine-generating enzyme required for sulfatase activity